MFDILEKISTLHLNILLLLGLALFGGTVGGRLFQKIRIPQVVGYIAIGILIGESGLKIVPHTIIEALQPLSLFALGLIGFTIGSELSREFIVKYGRKVIILLFFEGLGAFFLVLILVAGAGIFIFGDWKYALALGLLLGAISSATAPAATAVVLREFKTWGPLTKYLMGIVALDDGLALLLFALASSAAGSLMGQAHTSVWKMVALPFYEIGGAILIGVLGGLVLCRLLRKYSEDKRLLAFTIGTVLLATGLSITVHLDMLLASMTLGVVVTNFAPSQSRSAFRLVDGFTPPIYILFFVLVGAKLKLAHLTVPILLVGLIYLIGRTGGKALGANLGSRLAQVPRSVRDNLPLCLLSQAGVAIGLSILAYHNFPGPIGEATLIIITLTCFVLELLGPTMVKVAVTRAGEVGLDVTEEDVIHTVTARELMDKGAPLIYENMTLGRIVEVFSKSTNLFYAVVDHEKNLKGIITVDTIRGIFMEPGLTELLVAVDVMEPYKTAVAPGESAWVVREAMEKYNIEYLPVVAKDRKLAGIIERRKWRELIATRVMEVKKRVDLLGSD